MHHVYVVDVLLSTIGLAIERDPTMDAVKAMTRHDATGPAGQPARERVYQYVREQILRGHSPAAPSSRRSRSVRP
jgi:hypothetical protein